jgi:hypothetical protein
VRRLAIIACLAAPLTAAAAEPALAAQERAPLQARLVVCQAGATTATRAAVFTARMPAARGTTRMWMRFDLLQRTPGAAEYAPVKLPAWGVWQRSEPGRTAFIYTKRVQGLRAPGSYRARVRFRWYDADGRLQRTTTRTTRTCRQPDPRPNLTAGDVTVAGGLGAGTVTYLLDVGNEGRGAAGPFAVALAVAGVPQPPVAVDGLAAGARTVVSVTGPRCTPGSTVRFVLDPDADVAESDESDDIVDRPCPTGG